MTSAPTFATSPSDGAGPGAAYAIVIATRSQDDESQFLMVHHRERGWELPGGKLEDYEGPVHAALREFREETGHLLSEPRFVMKLPKPNGLCYVFTGRLGAKVSEVHDTEAVGAMRWYSRLPPAHELAFPEDPYDEMGAALGIDFGHPETA